MNESKAVLLGEQSPRILIRPEFVSTRGQEAIDLAASAGLVLDPWQELALNIILAQRIVEDRMLRWAAFQTGVIVPRQNGKGGILEALELFWIFLSREPLILHSAHEFKTSTEAFLRLLSYIENNDWLRKRCKKPRTSHGEEGFELLDGSSRLRFVARSNASGRGFTGHKIIFDEAFNLPAAVMAALFPTLTSVPDPQILYTTTTPAEIDDKSVTIRQVRARALSDNPGRVAWLEWSNEADVDPQSREAVRVSNPAYGIRINDDYIDEEIGTLTVEKYLVERLGVWPEDTDAARVIRDAEWALSVDHTSQIAHEPTFAIDVTPDRSMTAIGVAGLRSDNKAHVEVVEHAPGTEWVVDYMLGVAETSDSGEPTFVVIDPGSPAGSLIVDLEAAGIQVIKATGQNGSQAAGLLYQMATAIDLIHDLPKPQLRHFHDPRVNAALAGAAKKETGDGGFCFSRKTSTSDISCLVAITLALWGSREPRPSQRKPVWAW